MLVLDNGPVNTVDPLLIERLIEVLPSLTEDVSIRCLVIRGKERVFVGGADIRVMRGSTPTSTRRCVAGSRCSGCSSSHPSRSSPQ